MTTNLFHLEIDPYAGPLDLLLYLIRDKRLSVAEVRLSDIADQYIAYMKSMEARMDLELLGAYMVVAATLIEIKSRMLLPNPPQEESMESVVDLKEQLLVRLQENLQFRQLAERLGDMPQLYRDVFPRPDQTQALASTVVIWRRPTVVDLVDSFRQVLEGVQRRVAPIIRQSARTLRAHLETMAVALTDLFGRAPRVSLAEVDAAIGADREQRIYSFLGVLQLVKNRALDAEQEAALLPIWLRPAEAWSSQAVTELGDWDAETDTTSAEAEGAAGT